MTIKFIFTECAHAREVQFKTIHSRIVTNKMVQAINCDFWKNSIDTQTCFPILPKCYKHTVIG